MFGSHLSISGGLTNALTEAETLKLETVQIFTKNQQQWRAAPLAAEAVTAWRAHQGRLGWDGRTVAHASYLINLASPDDELWKKSIDLMEEELRRCEALGVAFLVHHPGAFTTSSLDEGLARIASAYAELFKRTPGFQTVSCLENTAGGGSTIGRDFAELSKLRELIVSGVPRSEGKRAGERVGFCFDTCHAHAAGYDMGSREAADRTLDEFANVCDLSHLRVLHLNDSKGTCGSRLDRHEHIGDGTIGLEGFRAVLNRRELRESPRPMILETPKGEDKAGTPLDEVNLKRLKKLVKR